MCHLSRRFTGFYGVRYYYGRLFCRARLSAVKQKALD